LLPAPPTVTPRRQLTPLCGCAYSFPRHL
jgi:hypothetical protein